MEPNIRAQSVLVALAAALAGCATAPEPRPPAPSAGLSCEPFEYKGEFPEAVSPETWEPKPCVPGFVTLRFVVEGQKVYAIGVPLRDGVPEAPFVVGPMENLPDGMPQREAAEMGRKYKDWRAFYQRLYRACGRTRPMALICPGPDCPMTPEIPPPGLLGMTASYGPGSLAALELDPSDRAYAARAEGEAGQTATDAVRIAPSVQNRTPEREQARRALISDTVTRAVCAAKILTVPR